MRSGHRVAGRRAQAADADELRRVAIQLAEGSVTTLSAGAAGADLPVGA
jgi:hypothetical protein